MNSHKATALLTTVTCALLLTLAVGRTACAKTIYVAPPPTGKDSNSGLSASLALATIQHAIDISGTNDVIQVAQGTYDQALLITKKNHLTITNAPSARPIIKGTGTEYHLITIAGSTYLTFTGFEVSGVGASQECDGILMNPYTDSTPYVASTHCTVSNCVVHDVGGTGILAWRKNVSGYIPYGCDYITVSNNTVYNASTTSPNNTSGISLLGCVSDGNSVGSNGVPNFHNFVTGNRVYACVNVNPDPSKHTDGNGIIIDTQLATGPWTLIFDNLVYKNGGRGIHVFDSSNVYVINNTTYMNGQDPTTPNSWGELTVFGASNILECNNVVQGASSSIPAFYVSSISGGVPNSNITFKYNTYTGTTTNAAGYIDWTTTIYSDPAWGTLFYYPEPSNPGAADFRLNYLAAHDGLSGMAAQSARDRGSSAAGEYSAADFNGTLRPQGAAVDRGAYEQ